MRIAVLTLTRDRLPYTEHCFARLRELAGCDFDHFVLDQGSSDGTDEWLRNEYDPDFLILQPSNIGISRGMNRLLDWVAETADYDVVVKIDNDCDLLDHGTLHDVAQLTMETGALLSPRVLGLNHPPASTGEWEHDAETIMDVPQIGGIFLAAPAAVYDSFRFDEDAPPWGTDDVRLCAWHRAHGGRVGYVKRLAVNHYETTSGQHARFPSYFDRTLAEGKPAL